MDKNTLSTNFLGCGSDFDSSDIIIFGAPYDGTTTFRPGARFAPSVMRMDSIGIETYSPYFDADITDYSINDYGDLDLPFGSPARALNMISETSLHIFDSSKKPLMIGGEHLVSLPVIEQACKKYPDMHVIHFDAHTDLREDYLGEALSHSSVIRRAWDILGDKHIWQFGIRSGTREEFYWSREGHTHMCMHNFDTLGKAVNAIGGLPVYLTIDLDVLDPSIFPGTGTPEAGGVSFLELVNALKAVSALNIIGADIVELSPHYDQSGSSTAAACKILRELVLTMQKTIAAR
ncbi:agmatinase [Ruminiclostridium sufflavum DSM 19573]|uniref:Agmatinase n=1 Tax=Ruminiclostridium sufflavum DSM 19573 TaxID=1121337 RepID=A0A318XJY8_9FIRM|nr:agmatinase [Ruminiclostridium sufflavum]PYG86663.1 agmatinase [Ruminiclostridium sufflavum DSM 19573]